MDTTPSSDAALDAFASVGDPASRRRGRRARRVAALGVVAVVLVGGTFAVRRASGSDNAGYRVATVGTHDVDAILSGVATIEPVSQATVAFPVAGTVKSVNVQPGDTVTAGQPLAALDTDELSQTLRQKQEALAQAQLVLSKALAGEDVSSLTGGSARAASFTSGADGSGEVKAQLLSVRVQTVAAVPTVDDGDISAAQQAVLAAQQQVDAVQATAATALQSAQTVCASVGTDTTPADGSGAGTSSSITSCQQALDDVLTAQQAVSDAQSALSTAMDHLDQLLQQLASEGSGGGSTTTTAPSTAPTTSAPSAPTTSAPGGRDHSSTTTPSSEPPTSTGGTGRSRSGGGFSTGGGGGTGGSGGASSSKSPSAADLVAYQAAVDAAAADVTAAEQAIAQATIVSPIAGTVVAVDLAVGDAATAGSSTQHIVVKGAGGFEATTTVSIDDVRDVKVGQAATVAPDGSTATFASKVVSVAAAPTTSTSSGTGSSSSSVYQVVLSLSGDTSKLGNGSIGSVGIVTDSSRSALAVPTSAITTTGNAHTVTVLEDGRATTAVVRIGAVGTTWTEVVRGLQAGQQVVLADLSQPLPSSATDTSRTGTNRNGTIQIGNRTIQFGNGGFRVAQRNNG